MNPREAEGFRYDRHWAAFDGARARTTWERLPEVLPAVGDESLDRRTLNDDYQQLFVCVVLDHARRTLEALAAQQEAVEVVGPTPAAGGRRLVRLGGRAAGTTAVPRPQLRTLLPAPLRVLLLGSAGSGKTRAVRTMLQELRRLLATWGRLAGGPLPLELANPDAFVRVAAPTGSAAFNIRFGATTIHRLIHWFRPGHFEEIRNDVALNRLQTSLGPTRLLCWTKSAWWAGR